MDETRKQVDVLFEALREHAKELSCLYKVEEILKDYDSNLEDVLNAIIKAIPPGWQYPGHCRARIIYQGREYHSADFSATEWVLTNDIRIRDRTVGVIEVYYTEEKPQEDEGPFLKEEVKLVRTIAERLGDYIQHKRLRKMIQGVESTVDGDEPEKTCRWHVVVDLSRRMDRDLFQRITRKMLNYLCWNGIEEANALLRKISSDRISDLEELADGSNRPQRRSGADILTFSTEIFNIADRSLPDDEILACVEKWMQEDRASFLIKTLVNLNSSLGDVTDALHRFRHLAPEGLELSDSILKGLKVSLIRKIITDQLDYIKVAKNYVEIDDFYAVLKRLIYPTSSHGQVGGKSAGLFLAWQIIKRYQGYDEELQDIRIPKTWCITSDGLHNFMHYNNMEDVTEQKYKDIGIVRQEYPHIIQLFKNSRFTPEIIQGLSMALDDLGETPIIVRSSSLLEDRFGASFSGKYKSLFLANQGSKKERLQALMDAIAEVYSSTFGSDPIEYRTERGLIDFKEEMGIIIQEVVGTRIGKYFMPTFAGVAFSNNEFCWSPRIKREDGLIRLVPGLGTRAVDRLSDDYPILIAPGQPSLRVNVTFDEIIRYSPNKMDVINLETNNFETVDIKEFLSEYGEEMPAVTQLISRIEDSTIRPPSPMELDFRRDELVVTFEGLIAGTPFIPQVNKVLKILQENLGTPVDIEFASDGRNFYLLQCRPQSFAPDSAPAQIPKDIPESELVFTANKYISNGHVPDITHIVYVDPAKYSEVEDHSTLKEVSGAVGCLNKLLPKRQFILMGPGRWGSRGDIKLGVSVTYSDISNCSVLIEIARQKGNYVPDLSFGTHFFQDLVETSIRYLPLYPDDRDIVFNERFLTGSRNILADILPEYAHLDQVVRVIDVPEVSNGKVLKVYMNADLDEAIGVISFPESVPEASVRKRTYTQPRNSDDHWRWRLNMAERIAETMDPDLFGVKAYYVFGSTKNGTAGPGSDIDILLHFSGTGDQRDALMQWLDGWSMCLDEMNYLRTGYRSNGLLDVHLVTDQDIREQSSFAVKINAVTDAAREIPLKRSN